MLEIPITMKRLFFAAFLFVANTSLSQELDSLETQNWELTCYPNPTSDLLVVKSNREIREIQIIDLTGSVVKANAMPNWCFSLNDLPSGWFFVFVVDESGNVEKRNIYKN